MHARVYILEVRKVSCLERCPQFRCVLIERGSTVVVISYHVISLASGSEPT